MIDKLTIDNVQSHRHSEFDFHPHINVIVGSSNNGKSAVLRALYWARYNRPLGIETLCSHWAINDKGNQCQPMSVKVVKDGKVLERRKTRTENQYILDGEELNAIRTEVPEQVLRFFKLSDTNIQGQQDSPFLLSLSSGDVAKYFNRIVKLDVIDNILSRAEAKRRELKKDVEQAERLVKEYEKKHDDYEWVKGAEKLLNSYESNMKLFSQLGDELDGLISEVDSFIQLSGKVERFNETGRFGRSVAKIEKLADSIDSDDLDLNRFSDEMERYKSLSNESITFMEAVESKPIIEKLMKIMDTKSDEDEISEIDSDISSYKEMMKVSGADFSLAKKIICDIENRNESEDESELASLESEIENYGSCTLMIDNQEKELKRLKSNLPEICPICGARMTDGHCEED